MSEPLKVDQLTADELESLQSQGRIQDGKIVDAPKAPKPAAGTIPKELVPDMPEGVKQRVQAYKDLNSSFVQTDTAGKVVAASPDGGKAAEAAAVKPEEVNQDWFGKPKEDPIAALDKAQFLAHLLGGVRFEKSYELFGGNLIVTFQTRTGDEEAVCNDQCWLDEKIEGTGNPNTQDAISMRAVRYHNYRWTASLKSIQKVGDRPMVFEPFEEKGDPALHISPIRAAHEKLLSFPAALLNVIQNTALRFEQLVAKMTLAADSPDFWRVDSGT